MRKLIIALLFAFMLCATLNPAVFAASNSMDIEIDGRQINLMFDPSEQFSEVSDGYVRASFYTFTDDGSGLYELYLIFPWDVQPGTTIDPEYARQNASRTSVMMTVATKADTYYYFAGQVESTDGTDYTLSFETVTDSDAGRTYSGTFSADMVGMSVDSDMEFDTLRIQDARFSFTMPARDNAAPDAPEATQPDDVDPFGGDDYDPFAAPSPAPTRQTYRV